MGEDRKGREGRGGEEGRGGRKTDKYYHQQRTSCTERENEGGDHTTVAQDYKLLNPKSFGCSSKYVSFPPGARKEEFVLLGHRTLSPLGIIPSRHSRKEEIGEMGQGREVRA